MKRSRASIASSKWWVYKHIFLTWFMLRLNAGWLRMILWLGILYDNGLRWPFLNWLHQTRFLVKPYIFSFLFWENNFSKLWLFHKKYLCVNLLKIFSLVPTTMIDFNKWGLKWKEMKLSMYFRKTNRFFLSIHLWWPRGWKKSRLYLCPNFHQF